MKKLLIISLMLPLHLFAQSDIKDNAVRHQEERMVYDNWDQNKFDPKAGFLDLNPYYWLVWGLFYPNYHKTDLRPLSATGPQTQRLLLVGAQNNTDGKYKLQSDTLRSTALSQIASQTGTLSATDPLWVLYYKGQFAPLAKPVAPLPNVSADLYSWYTAERAMLKQRLDGAQSTDMDRGSRIMAYYRLLNDYKSLTGVWAVKVAAAQQTAQMNKQSVQLKTGTVTIPDWTPASDVGIANKVLLNRKY